MPISPSQLAGLIKQHAIPLQIWAGRRCDTPEDIVQEAFCRLSTEKQIPPNTVAWLYRVVRNMAENERLSSQRRRNREVQVASRESYQFEPIEQLEQQEILEAVLNLESPYREIVTARIWGHLSFEEIGELCQLSPATTFRRYQSALELIRKELSIPCPTSNS